MQTFCMYKTEYTSIKRTFKILFSILVLLFFIVGVAIGIRWDLKHKDSKKETNADEKTFFTDVDKSVPGYWLTDQDRDVLAYADRSEIIGLLDIPRGYHERDLSSKPADVPAAEYYTSELNLLYLEYDGVPMWSSLDTQKKYLETVDLINDKDSDGLTDFEERHIYKTSVSKQDTDGDGYADLDEITNGYDPRHTDKLLNESRLGS